MQRQPPAHVVLGWQAKPTSWLRIGLSRTKTSNNEFDLAPFRVPVVHKPTFGSVNLAKEICNYSDLKEVEVIGFCTDVCVISNILMMKPIALNLTLQFTKIAAQV